MYFDVRAAKQLEAGQHITVDGCPGLRLAASASRKTWIYRYKAPATGRMKQVALGQYPAMPVQTAATAWDEFRKLRADATDPGEWQRSQKRAQRAPASEPAGYTVRKLVQDYIKGHIEVERQEAGAIAARRALERLLEEEPAFAEGAAAAVTRSKCFDLLEARKATPMAAQKLRSLLGAAWARALDSGRLDQNTPNWWPAVHKGRLKSKGKVVGGEHQGQQRRILRDEE
jgi:hypothetical protein